MDRRQGQRDAVDERLETGRPPGDAAVLDLELRRAGEERRHVAVAAEPEQEQVQLDAVERRVVLGGGVGGRELAAHPVHLERRYGQPVEERLLREAIVRALVLGRHAALVAPPQRHLAPVRLELGRALVGLGDRVAAGEHDRAAAGRLLCEQLGDDRGWIVDDVEVRRLRHAARV